MESKKCDVFVFGDSHSLIWAGIEFPNTEDKKEIPGVTVWHLGPALAQNLMDSETGELRKYGHEIFDNLRFPKVVVLCFGEIDVRTAPGAFGLAALRLAHFVRKLRESFDIKVLVMSPPPACEAKFCGDEYPAVGSIEERTNRLQGFCSLVDFGIKHGFLNVPDILEGAGLVRSEDIFSDGVHLNRKAFALVLNHIRTSPDLREYAPYFQEV